MPLVRYEPEHSQNICQSQQVNNNDATHNNEVELINDFEQLWVGIIAYSVRSLSAFISRARVTSSACRSADSRTPV